MRHILIFLLTLISSYLGAQTNFSKGFETGFKSGYCYNKSNCIPPISPICPLPTINESYDNYNDGYNRGFQVGLDLSRVNSGLNANDNYNYTRANEIKRQIFKAQDPIMATDLELLRLVNSYKQQLFDLRTQWTQERINYYFMICKSFVYPKNTELYNQAISSFSNAVHENLDKPLDYSNDMIFSQIQNFMARWINYAFKLINQ